ncbi:hypothetical protein Bca101_059745 [Brassica carinata]
MTKNLTATNTPTKDGSEMTAARKPERAPRPARRVSETTLLWSSSETPTALGCAKTPIGVTEGKLELWRPPKNHQITRQKPVPRTENREPVTSQCQHVDPVTNGNNKTIDGNMSKHKRDFPESFKCESGIEPEEEKQRARECTAASVKP